MKKDLPVIQKTYDLVKWYVPILNKLPRDHKFGLGERMVSVLYGLLEGLIEARYASSKLSLLRALNTKLDVLRYQTRLLMDLELMPIKRYRHAAQLIDEIGIELGAWIKQQTQRR